MRRGNGQEGARKHSDEEPALFGVHDEICANVGDGGEIRSSGDGFGGMDDMVQEVRFLSFIDSRVECRQWR